MLLQHNISFCKTNKLIFYRYKEKPIFCVGAELADDGSSGRYIGLGYSFDIEGNFMPEDEFPGVTKWTFFLFGIEVQSKIRE